MSRRAADRPEDVWIEGSVCSQAAATVLFGLSFFAKFHSDAMPTISGHLPPQGDMSAKTVWVSDGPSCWITDGRCRACEIRHHLWRGTELYHINLPRAGTAPPKIWCHPERSGPSTSTIGHRKVEVHLIQFSHAELAVWHGSAEAACLPKALHGYGCGVALAHLAHVPRRWCSARGRRVGSRRPNPIRCWRHEPGTFTQTWKMKLHRGVVSC